MMLVRAAGICMVSAFLVSKLHNFHMHWHKHSRTWHAARLLLDSDVCTHAHIRMSLREFDNCNLAESVTALAPLSRAVYSVAEEMHLCGNNRCAVLYMDITDRLTYIVVIALLLVGLLLIRAVRHCNDSYSSSGLKRYRLPYRFEKED